ncbi:MAG: antibiotic biosynthesis monooxygenase [Proteobacteria bacterium]|nr:antibiotic biosynthesis monooxygenase [Pseudomonadota bacterium]
MSEALPLGVIARFSVQPDRADVFREIAERDLVAPSRTEPDCVRHELWQDAQDPAQLAMVEQRFRLPAAR